MSGKENGMDDIRKFPGRFPEEPYREESEGRRMPGYRGNQRSYREYNREGAPEEWRNGGANMNYGCPYGNCGAPGTPLPFYMTYPMPMFWRKRTMQFVIWNIFFSSIPRMPSVIRKNQ